MRDEIEQYRRCEVSPFGVNPASASQHADYAAQLQLPFPLLSDPDLSIARAYGTVRPLGTGIARSVCLIDRGGVVLYTQAGSPGAELILESLRCS